MSKTTVPKAIRWQTLVVITIVAVVAILIGVGFAGPLRSGLTTAGHWIGFGHDHEDEAVAVTDESGQVQYYTCGMHPWVILPKPGDCPICHMELTPIDPNKFTGEIAIDPVIVQNMGVRVQPVVTGPLTRTIRTVGTVDYNERAVRDVNIKTPGWIEKLHVDFVGARVKAGEPLFELYSPQLFAAQEEYLLAKRSAGTAGEAKGLLEAARTRLEYFDITDQQITALEAAGKPAKTMTIESPHTGVVIAKHANEGMKVDPGMQVFRIADLSTVWVLVTLYEYQLPYIETGMKATMSLPYIPGQTLEGEVIYIYPYLDKKTREVQVRLEFDNPRNLLKPGMFANVTLENTLASEKTLAPRSAVIDTGERQVAFVSRGEGKFEPRDVRLGVETGDGMVEIIAGLKPGEMVVTSGQFLIDSEAKMREALAKMIKGDLAADQEAAAELAGASALKSLPEPVAETLNTAMQHYLAVGEALATDSTEGVADHAEPLANALDELIKQELPDHPHFWHEHQDAIATARSNAFKLIDTDDLAEARLQFAEVSTSLEMLLMATGVPPSFEREMHVLHCPMYRKGQGGTIWLQSAGDVRNPYFGSEMLECFDKRKALPVTGQEAGDGQHDEDEGGGDAESESGEIAMAPADSLPTGVQMLIDELYGEYIVIHSVLAQDIYEPVPSALKRIDRIADYLVATGATEWKAVADLDLAAPTSLSEARDAFRKLSQTMVEIVEQRPPSANLPEEGETMAAIHVAKCPMAKGGVWLQIGDSVRNPYYGSQMPDCGSIQKAIDTVEAARTGYYYCPMHPWILTSQPGACPIGEEPLQQLPRSRIVNELLQSVEAGQVPTPSQPAKKKPLPKPVANAINAALENYLAIGRKLASDSVDGIADPAAQLAESLGGFDELDWPGGTEFWKRHNRGIVSARHRALTLSKANKLADAREAYASISEVLQTLLADIGVPVNFGQPVQSLHCPMYQSDDGGSIWLQTQADARNPYFGSVMLECFDERSMLPVAGNSARNAQAAQTVDDYPIDFCLVTGRELGSMGKPVTLEYEGRTLKFCCDACIGKFQENPEEYLKKLDEAAETLGKTQGGR